MAAQFFKANTIKPTLYFLIAAICSEPLLAEAAQADAREWRYSARPGDNLIVFARKHLKDATDWRTLQTLNRIENPKRIAVGQIIRVPLHLLNQSPVPAVVNVITGDVSLKLTETESRALSIGDKVYIGSEIVTGKNSKAVLKMADDSLVTVEQNSSLNLNEMSVYSGGGMVDTQMRLQTGRVEIKANPQHKVGNQMQIVTPTAVAAVRGTTFRVGAEANKATQETLDGRVDLAASGQITAVAKGYGSAAEAGKAPIPPVVLLPAPQFKNASNLVAQSPSQIWLSDVAGAVSYTLALAQTSTINGVKSEKIVYSELAAQPMFDVSQVPDGRYGVIARAVDVNGLYGFDAINQLDINAQPSAPVINLPRDIQLNQQEHIVLSWAKVPKAQQYLLEVADNAMFQNAAVKQTLSDTSFSFLPLANTYFWRVTSVDHEGLGPLGFTQKATYTPPPATPDLTFLKVQIDQNTMSADLDLPNQTGNQAYEMLLSADAQSQNILWKGQSDTGHFELPRAIAGNKFVSFRAIDRVSGKVSAFSQKEITIPAHTHDWQPEMLLQPQSYGF